MSSALGSDRRVVQNVAPGAVEFRQADCSWVKVERGPTSGRPFRFELDKRAGVLSAFYADGAGELVCRVGPGEWRFSFGGGVS